MTKPELIAANLARLRGRIAAAARQAGRSVDSVTLLGAGKSQPAAAVAAAAAAGLAHVGESYVQEALARMDALADLPVTWHFIGALQANKTRPVAERFAWVHGVERLKIAERLSQQRPFHAPPLNVCLQVNIGGELTKSGAEPAEVPALAAAVARLPRLKLRGLMCLPPPEAEPARQRAWLHRLRALFDELNAGGAGLDTLSMGMSADLESAVLEGATIVRVGTDLFGPRR
ncbi:MAG TPA: YggS family pyridoxal phosphate-dependent enzyme [Steroidobacteraceae bacterium]|nr:YggS family pyridoxal phosphate-dependent enzyme [Steroidobacteraceae bacterium]